MTDLMHLFAVPGTAPVLPSSGLPGYPQSALLTHAHGLWLAARGRAEMPARAAFDAPAFEPLRPQALLFAVETPPLDFRYLEIGSRMQAISNNDYTGLCVSQIGHQRAPSRVWEHLAAAVDARAPIKGVLPYVGRSREIGGIYHIVMPLAEDGERVDHLLVCVDLSPAIRLQDGTDPFTQLG